MALDVAVHEAVGVQVGDGGQDLAGEDGRESCHIVVLDEGVQVAIAQLEEEHDRPILDNPELDEMDNVLVAKLVEEHGLLDGARACDIDFLERIEIARLRMVCLVDAPLRACADFSFQLEVDSVAQELILIDGLSVAQIDGLSAARKLLWIELLLIDDLSIGH